MPQSQRNNLTVRDKSGSETGPQTEVEHAAPLVTPQRLHRCVIHHPQRATEGLGKIEVEPAPTEIVRLAGRSTVDDITGKSNGSAIKLPVSNGLRDLPDELIGRQFFSRRKF